MRELSERQKWFRSKIGSRLFRNDNGCICEICQHIVQNGLIITDQMQADHCYDTETEYTAEGNPLRYFDTKDEATQFSVQQKT
jgi:hypothetical protein